MRAAHATGTATFDVHFTIQPHTVKEIMSLIDIHHPRSLEWLDCSNIRIQNQIKD